MRRVIWWLLAVTISPLVVLMREDTIERLLSRATLRSQFDERER
jgi:hypothetical protein